MVFELCKVLHVTAQEYKISSFGGVSMNLKNSHVSLQHPLTIKQKQSLEVHTESCDNSQRQN